MNTRAYAYLRTSSATNSDGDSGPRQRAAIAAYAEAHGIELAGEYWDLDTKGSEPVTARPKFADMLAAIAGDGVKAVLVENASRFARDLIVQETGYAFLRAAGIALIACDDPDAFTAETPTAVMIRQILGAVSQFEKANLVAKLRAARDRRTIATGHCEGRPPVPEECRKLARELRRDYGAGISLREISARLALAGFVGPSGRRYFPASIAQMLR